MKERNGNSLFAIGLIVVGLILILKVFNLPFLENFNLGFIIGIAWPMFILIPGLNMLKKKVDFGGLILTFFGAAFLLDNVLKLYNIDFKATIVFKFFWPLLFIFIGYKMLRGSQPVKVGFNHDFEEPIDSGKSTSITFNSKKYNFYSANMEPGVTQLNLNISFGGAEIIVEEGIQVILLGQYTFGGHEFFGHDAGGIHSDIKEVRYAENEEDNFEKTLFVRANITFGGLELRKR